jgi:hypothetical protein
MTTRPSPTFAAVVGVLLGVLSLAVFLPHHPTEIRTEAGATGGAVAASGADAGSSAATPTAAGAAPSAAAAAGDTAVAGAAGSGAVAAAGGGKAAGGSATAAPGGGSAAAGPAGSAASAGAPAATGRGVTASSVTIGVALLDLGAIRNLGPMFDNGDRRGHFESILAEWRRTHVIPVAGRDVKFVYRTYDVLDASSQRAACVGLIQDEKVFAVIADSDFLQGSECVAREFHTPLLEADAVADEVYARSAPNLFTLQMSVSRLMRNWVDWADSRKLLQGHKIGLYYLDTPDDHHLVDTTIKPELGRLHHSLAAEAVTAHSLGGPEDALAVQRFRAAGVDVALLLTSKAGFMQQATAQGYKPSYLDNDYLSGTTNTATSTYPAAQYDGTYGISGLRYGEWKSGIPSTPEAAACQEAYQRASGKRIDGNSREAEWVALNKGCDDGRVFLLALQRAGAGLTPATFVSGLESIKGLHMGMFPDLTFAPGKHHGIDAQRTLQWHADCSCWRVVTPFGPLWVP